MRFQPIVFTQKEEHCIRRAVEIAFSRYLDNIYIFCVHDEDVHDCSPEYALMHAYIDTHAPIYMHTRMHTRARVHRFCQNYELVNPIGNIPFTVHIYHLSPIYAPDNLAPGSDNDEDHDHDDHDDDNDNHDDHEVDGDYSNQSGGKDDRNLQKKPTTKKIS